MNSQGRDETETFDRDLHWADDALAPSPRFVAQLRASLRAEACRIEAAGTPSARRDSVPLRMASVPARGRPSRPVRRAFPLVNRAATVGLIAILLVLSVTVLDEPATPDAPTAIPGGFAASPPAAGSAVAAVPASTGDPARTNVQPGPGLTTPPEIALRSNVSGYAMALSDGVLVVVGPTKVTALDAVTLRELWSVAPPPGAYSSPTIAGGRIYFTYASNTEAGTGKASENQLVALSLQDGRELWRVDGAGSYPASPIVQGDVVYSVGVADGRFQVGAYRSTDGRSIWQSEGESSAWCCPVLGIALANGLLAVSDGEALTVYAAASGERRWSRTPKVGDFVGPPMIAGDSVVVNAADQPSSDLATPIAAGSTTAYDLRSGDILWSNPSTRGFGAPLSGSPAGVLYAGPWAGEDADRLVLFSAATGDTVWSTPLPHVPRDAQNFIGPPGNPASVIAGDTAYVTVGTFLVGGALTQSRLIAEVDLATGTVRWTAQLDGTVISMPIVSGGRIFVLSYDAGLVVLGESGQPASQPGPAVDLRRPVLCNALPSESPMLGTLPATPSIPGVAAWKEPIQFSQIPSGVPRKVDPAVAAQLEQRFNEYRSCSQVDPYNSVFGFFSTDFYVRLLALDESVYDNKVHPWAIWMASMVEFLYLETNSLQMLPDGRIGGLINSQFENIYVWWVLEDGVWKIDEYHRVQADPVDPNAATPTPSLNPAGTPYG